MLLSILNQMAPLKIPQCLDSLLHTVPGTTMMPGHIPHQTKAQGAALFLVLGGLESRGMD